MHETTKNYSSLFVEIMESTRDVDAASSRASDLTSIASTTVSQLNEPKSDKNIVNANKSTAKLALITEAINETIAENNARGKEIKELFSMLDLNPKFMPKDIQDPWNEVSAILSAEGLADLNSISLKLCIERKKRESMKRVREERKLKAKYNELCDRHAGVLEKQNQVRDAVESLQRTIESVENGDDEEYANGIFMATKLNDYRQTIKELDQELTAMGADEYHPQRILEKYNTCLVLTEELNEVERSLSKYGELPANLSEARALVEEKEQYLKDLEHALFIKMQ